MESRITRLCLIRFTGLLLALLLLATAKAAASDTFSVLSYNMQRLFDDVDNGMREPVLDSVDFERRINLAANKFEHEFALPQIIALQEVENTNVLHRIAAVIRQRFATTTSHC